MAAEYGLKIMPMERELHLLLLCLYYPLNKDGTRLQATCHLVNKILHVVNTNQLDFFIILILIIVILPSSQIIKVKLTSYSLFTTKSFSLSLVKSLKLN